MIQKAKLFLLATLLVSIHSCSWFRGKEEGGFVSNGISNAAKAFLEGTVEIKTLTAKDQLKVRQYIRDRCIEHSFDSGEETNLYGEECLQGQKIVIRTGRVSDGEVVPSFSAVIEGETHGVRTEAGKEPDFINKVYKLPYHLVSSHEDNSPVSWLQKLLPEEKEDFIGLPDTEYHIIFEVVGNYLVLFKASKKLENIPSMERTSIPHDENMPSADEDGFYKLPFLGYKIESCYTEYKTTQTGEYTNSHRLVCKSNKENLEDSSSAYVEGLNRIGKDIGNTGKVKYITLRSAVETYKMLLKKNLFPADYFDGEWFLAFGLSETPRVDGELPPENAFHVKLKRTNNFLEAEDISGNVPATQRQVIPLLPVEWVDYELNKEGGSFLAFGESLDKNLTSTQTNYLKIQFDRFGAFHRNFDRRQDPSETNITDLLVTENYISFKAIGPYTYTESTGNDTSRFQSRISKTVTATYQYSLLRKSALDTKGFLPRRFHQQDNNKYFGILKIEPQDITRTGEVTVSDLSDHVRMIRFNTALNSKEEKVRRKKIIKWYFSKNSSQDPYYRALARQAINIYNKAFELIHRGGSNRKIELELIEDEAKDLGDLRYNIINLIDRDEDSGLLDGLLGFAPSYIYADTGQIISSSTNVFIQNTEEIYIEEARRYTRHEIFQKTNPFIAKGLEVTSEYMKTQIEKKCNSLISFIETKKQEREQFTLRPDMELNDKEELIACGKKLAEGHILNIILHEIGHSLGLGHNFKASLDKDNYYQSVAEIDEICPDTEDFKIARSFIFSESGKIEEYPKSSSVMDYLPSGTHFLPCLGKYDLAALRFLYNEEFETIDGKFLPLDLPEDPIDQRQLSAKGINFLSQIKTYHHCSDWLNNIFQRNKGVEGSTLCAKWDYGSSPKEIVEYYIDRIKRDFNSKRYRYDRSLDTVNATHSWITKKNPDLIAMELLYKKWITLKNNYLETKEENHVYRIASGQKSAEAYKDDIEKGKKSNEKYALYFEIREPVYNFLTDILFQESMQCKVAECQDEDNCNEYKEGTERFVNLQFVALRGSISRNSDNPFYVENCHSPDIRQFFKNSGLKVIGEKGIEDFKFYNFVAGQEQVSQKGWNIIPYDVSHNLHVIKQVNSIFFHSTNMKDMTITNMMHEELDLFEDFRVRLFDAILKPKTSLNITDLTKLKDIYNELFLQNLNSIQQKDRDVLEQNENYLQSVTLREGLNDNSFNTALNMPLFSNSIDLLPFPFIRDVYTCIFKNNEEEDPICSNLKDGYNTEEELDAICPLVANSGSTPVDMPSIETTGPSSEKGLAISHLTQCLVKLNETLSRGSGSLVFPFSTEGFAVEAIRAYNKNLKEIEFLRETPRDLAPFQEMELSFREEYKNHLDAIIQLSNSSPGGHKILEGIQHLDGY